MKSRAIAAGATVIVVSLAGAGQAQAIGLGEVAQPVAGHTEATVNGPGGSVTVEGNVKVPAVGLPSQKKSHGGEVKPLDHSNADLEVNRRSGQDTSEAYLGWNGKSASLYAGQRRKGRFEVETQSRAGRNGADTAVNAVARPKHTRALRRAHDGRAKDAARFGHTARNRAHAATQEVGSGEGHHKGLAPLRSIGREVGNPVGLSLAGWMTLLVGGLGLAVGQMSRRSRRLD